MPSKTRGEETGFGVWRSGESGLTVEYSLQVLEELRAFAHDGYLKIPHGGIEVGGLLLGTVEDGQIRVSEWRPIECEHARGPGFVLSENDLDRLGYLLEQVARDPVLEGLAPVGWFHSHTRSSLFLSEEDIAIHNRFFPDPWQTAFVVAIAKDQVATGGFFFRDAGGAIDGRPGANEFPVRPNPAVLTLPKRISAAPPAPVETVQAAPATPVRRERRKSQVRQLGFDATAEGASRPENAVPPSPDARMTIPPYQPAPPELLEEPPRVAFKWRLLAVLTGVLALAAVAILTRPLWWPSTPEAISLRVDEAGSQIVIRWDHRSPAVRRANRALLAINDGGSRLQIDLNTEETQRGSVTYARVAEDVEVRLTLFEGGRDGLQESARFLGQAVAPPKPEPPRDPAELRADRDRLRLTLDQEKARGAKLREDVRQLEQRLNREKSRSRSNGATARK